MAQARTSRSIIGAAVLSGAMTLGAAVTTAAGDGSPAGSLGDLRVEVLLHGRCMEVMSIPGPGTVTVQHKRDGKVIASDAISPSGDRIACVKPIRPGDRITVSQGALQRTATAPTMTLVLDAADDGATGTIPTNALNETIELQFRIAGLGNSGTGQSISAAPDGSFSVDFGSGIDLRGGDPVSIKIETPAGHVFRLQQAIPAVVVEVGKARVTGHVRRGQGATITLKNGATTRGTRAASSVPGGTAFAGPFKKNGGKVPVAAGNKVFHSQASGARLTVLPGTLDVETTDNGSLTATCFPSGDFIVFVKGSFRTSGVVDPDGDLFLVNLTADGGDLVSGDRIVVACDRQNGSGQVLRHTVP